MKSSDKKSDESLVSIVKDVFEEESMFELITKVWEFEEAQTKMFYHNCDFHQEIWINNSS